MQVYCIQSAVQCLEVDSYKYVNKNKCTTTIVTKVGSKNT